MTSFAAFWGIFTQTQQNGLGEKKKKNKCERNKKITAALAHAQNPREFLTETCQGEKNNSDKVRSNVPFAPSLPSVVGELSLLIPGSKASPCLQGPCQPLLPPATLVPCQPECSIPALPAPVTAREVLSPLRMQQWEPCDASGLPVPINFAFDGLLEGAGWMLDPHAPAGSGFWGATLALG